ncbi:NAD(P)/FAD-dependent oxidoreductase [Rhizobium viscosum]|uniref:NADPH-dependent 2,4-dienoyl-CoA reductase/sulfur reductase-like enzyme n=1 Tax=Rhizobium viscosum TaxID=1673 RepID=A0ABR9IZI3_RHIVS|nr:NAD(P)/FAD-dependent oxidoreductase [Rhizobium viscosum]MBE1508639.1 NADPH-dependent 2,4-dienoyl-CoA reductase/sulfur reductase-like enzyme [Rhizobium viscosum]
MIRSIQSATDLAPAYDVVVVGAGPAGLSAAIEASIHGLAVLLADENESPGGQIYRSVEHASDADLARMGPDYTAGRTLIERFRQGNLSYAPRATVWSVGPADEEVFDGAHPLEVGISLGGIARPIAAHRVILATGALERPFPFPGWTMPGVMAAGAAQILMKSSGLVPLGRTILAGTGPLLYLLASQLLRAGVSVTAVVDTTPVENWRSALPHLLGFATSPYALKGLKLLLEVHRRTRVIRGVTALEAAGSGQFGALRVHRGNKSRHIQGDLLLLHQGIAPNLNLTLAAGCDYAWDDRLAAFRPVVDGRGTSSVRGISIAGDAAGIVGAVASAHQGELAGLSAALNLNRIGHGAYEQRQNQFARKLALALRGRTFIEHRFRPGKTFRVPEDDGTIVCRCEEITAGKLREVAALDVPGLNQMKAFTRCGMGPCQGRLCGLTAVELLAQCRGVPAGEVGYYRLRPPIKPVPLGEFAALPYTDAAIVAVAGFLERASDGAPDANHGSHQ